MKFSQKLSWTLFGNLFYTATQFFTLSFIAKLGGVEEVGVFTFSLAICSPIFLFFNVKLRSVILTDLGSLNTPKHFLYLRSTTNLIAVIVIVAVAFFLNVDSYIFAVTLLLAISKVFEMKSDIYYGFFQKENHYDAVGKSTMLRGVISLVLTFFSYYYFRNLTFLMLAFIVSNILVYFFFDRRQMKKVICLNNNEKKDIKFYINLFNLFLVALPLGLSTVVGSLNTNFPRLLIENKLGLYELGVFSALAYLLIIGSTLLTAISQVVTPSLARYAYEKKYAMFKKILLRIEMIGILLSIVSIIMFYLFGEQIILLVYTEEYLEYIDVFSLIIIGLLFSYSSMFLGTAITALRLFKIQPLINGVGFIITVVLSLLLITPYGLKGIAIALLGNGLTITILYILILSYIFKKWKNTKQIL